MTIVLNPSMRNHFQHPVILSNVRDAGAPGIHRDAVICFFASFLHFLLDARLLLKLSRTCYALVGLDPHPRFVLLD
jgi:hypothetical protein